MSIVVKSYYNQEHPKHNIYPNGLTWKTIDKNYQARVRFFENESHAVMEVLNAVEFLKETEYRDIDLKALANGLIRTNEHTHNGETILIINNK